MIPVSAIQKTAEALMAKAAIEIPDDGLGRALVPSFSTARLASCSMTLIREPAQTE
jgi:hypothetical protein